MNLIIKAITISAQKHISQKRYDNKVPGGSPYINHPISVADRVSKLLETEKKLDVETKIAIICASYLHDIVEDTDATIEYLEEEFGGTVARIVAGVTDNPDLDKVEKKKYKLKNVNSLSAEIIIVLFADKLDNLQDIYNYSNNSEEFIGYAYWCLCLVNNLKKIELDTIRILGNQITEVCNEIIGDKQISLEDYYNNINLSN